MRIRKWLGAGLLTASLTASVVGQAPPPPIPPQPAPQAKVPAAPVTANNKTSTAPAVTPATIVVPEAEVRARPGGEIYVTNRVRQGQVIKVRKEREDGWLEIDPPEGSFSWVNTRYVERIAPNQPNWAVTSQSPVPILTGSEVLKGRPNVEGARLQQGAQVRAVGSPLTDSDGSWLPIEPPPGEVRYVRAEAIGKTPATPGRPDAVAERFTNPTAGNRVETTVQASPASLPKPASPMTALAPLVDLNGLIQRAQQAEKAGDLREAIRLYNQIGSESAATNRELATQAYNRAFWLQETANKTAAASRFTPAPAPAAAPAPQPSATLTPSQSFSRPAGMADAANLPSSGPGRLRRAGRSYDNRPTYVLDDSRGLPRMYATPQPGVDLEPFVGRNVELFGALGYHGGMRANLMTVTRVQPLP